MNAGWLDDITNWFREQFEALFAAFIEYLGDLLIDAIKALLELAALAIEALPAPDFLQQYNLDTLLGQAGPVIGWVVATFKIGQCLSVIGAGYAFRRFRRLFTLGMW